MGLSRDSEGFMVENEQLMALLQPFKRVTLRDLARELGLSDRAVSQALTPRESNVKLNPKTVERVQKLALERNYRPDSRARSMRYGRFYNVGYFEAKKKATSWPLLGVESGVFDAASENQYRVVLIRLPSELTRDKTSIPSTFREGNLDALILSHAGNLTPEVEEVIDASGFPVVYLNEKKKHNAVYADDRSGAVEITRHLISLGRRKIVYLAADPASSHYSVLDRQAGYEEAMRQAGLEPVIVPGPDDALEWRRDDMLRLLRTPGAVEAVVTYSDFTALQLYRLMCEQGIALHNLAVTGFDDFAQEVSPMRLTTMKIPLYDMGRAAVEMALTLVNNNQKTVPSRIFPVELAVRQSTRPSSA
jgi:LacI family transcriptional regulator